MTEDKENTTAKTDERKKIIFDTGPLISLTLNNLTWVIEELKKNFQGDFLVPEEVKKELIDKPLTSKKYKLEALQLLPYFNKEIFRIYHDDLLEQTTKDILELANNCFQAKGKYIQAVHHADMQVVATAYLTGTRTVVIDEYTSRYLIESPSKIAKRMERKLHTKIHVDRDKIDQLKEYTKNIRVLRSVELITLAYEKKILDRYLFEGEKRFVKKPKKTLLEGALWGLKLNGCSVTEDEINEVLSIEGHVDSSRQKEQHNKV